MLIQTLLQAPTIRTLWERGSFAGHSREQGSAGSETPADSDMLPLPIHLKLAGHSRAQASASSETPADSNMLPLPIHLQLQLIYLLRSQCKIKRKTKWVSTWRSSLVELAWDPDAPRPTRLFFI